MDPEIESLAPVLAAAADELGVALSPEVCGRLLRYIAMLQRWNAVYNLTAVREPQRMLRQHLIDCMAVLPPLRRFLAARPAAGPARVLDVGSGGGLPGVVLALLEPGIEVTCVDAVAKKAGFVRQVAAELSVTRLRAEHARVESLAPPRKFDVVVSRAFASLPDFVALSRGALSEGGAWLAMKGVVPKDELSALPADIDVFHVEHLHVPGLDAQRCLIWMQPKEIP